MISAPKEFCVDLSVEGGVALVTITFGQLAEEDIDLRYKLAPEGLVLSWPDRSTRVVIFEDGPLPPFKEVVFVLQCEESRWAIRTSDAKVVEYKEPPTPTRAAYYSTAEEEEDEEWCEDMGYGFSTM